MDSCTQHGSPQVIETFDLARNAYVIYVLNAYTAEPGKEVGQSGPRDQATNMFLQCRYLSTHIISNRPRNGPAESAFLPFSISMPIPINFGRLNGRKEIVDRSVMQRRSRTIKKKLYSSVCLSPTSAGE